MTVPEREVSIQKEWPFRSSVVGSPPWVMLQISIRSPLRFHILSKTQKKQTNSLLRRAKCRGTSAATVGLWPPPLKLCYAQSIWGAVSKFGEKWQTSGFLVCYSLAHLFWLFLAFFSPTFSQCLFHSFTVIFLSVCCICSPVICLEQCLNDSLSFLISAFILFACLSVFNCLSAYRGVMYLCHFSVPDGGHRCFSLPFGYDIFYQHMNRLPFCWY